MRVRLLVMVVLAATAMGADWPQWRGPYSNGSSDEAPLPASLDPNTLLWKRTLPGISAATPVVLGGKIYLPSTDRDSERLLALCVDAATGKSVWGKAIAEAGQKLPLGNTMASCSACADATGVTFLFGEGTLAKLSPAGAILWQRNLVEDYGPLSLKFGYSASPLLVEDRLYITVLRRAKTYRSSNYTGSLASYLLGVDAATGKTLFKQDRPTDADDESTNAYTTPIAGVFGGRAQIIVYGGDYLTGHDPLSGAELWRHRYAEPRANMDRLIASAVADGERLYCAYPRGGKTFAIRPGGDPNGVWVHDAPSPDVPCPVLYKGYLYQIAEKAKTLTCLEAETGTVQWVGQLDKSDLYYASITAADNKLYMVNRAGVVTVAAADPKAFGILHTLEVGEKPVDSTMVVADGRIFLRTAESLYCWGIDPEAKDAEP